MQVLNSDAVRATLSDRVVGLDYERTTVRTTDHGEQFFADGRYVLLSDRASIEGRYVFRATASASRFWLVVTSKTAELS